MGRVNVFGRMENEDGRSVALGGMRGAQNQVKCWINTENFHQKNCGISVWAEVSGFGLLAKDRKKKSIGDGRMSNFIVQLPSANPGLGQVSIELHNSDREMGSIPHVILPGGHTLQYALSCVALYEHAMEVQS